jgi:hypothetical protein
VSVYEEQNRAMIGWLDGRSPEQRHFVALLLNWDFAEPTLDWLVTRPDCDLATAVELLWLAQPSEMIEYGSKELLKKKAPYFDWAYDFITGILNRFDEGFYSRSQIEFDRLDERDELASYRSEILAGKKLAWLIPEVFASAKTGTKIDKSVPGSEFWSEELRLLLAGLGTHWRGRVGH